MHQTSTKDVGLPTLSGRQFKPWAPTPEAISIHDIAGSLSKICRYGGHCREFYSVAEHSVLLCSVAPKELKLEALMHDASEAYIGDIVRGLKPHLGGYHDMEYGLMAVIAEKYDFDWPLPAVIKELDDRIIADERAQIMNPGDFPWREREPLGVKLQLWEPHRAAEEFFDAFVAHCSHGDFDA